MAAGGNTSLIARPGGRLIFLAVCGLGLSAVVTQLTVMREMLSVFCGNEMVLGVILGNWLLLTGVGAYLGRTSARLTSPVRLLIGLQLAVALLPLGQVLAMRWLRDVVFVRGAMIGVSQTAVASFLLLLPYCLASGYMLTLACGMLAARGGAGGIGKVYLGDSIGSIAGGLVFSFILVRWLDHVAILYMPAAVNLALACAVALHFRRRGMLAMAAAAAGTLAVLVATTNLDAVSTALQFPLQKVVFRGNSPYGRLVVTESAGQINFVQNGLTVASTNNDQQAEEAVHYAMAQRPAARQVLLLGGGASGSPREVLKYGVEQLTYVELDPLIVDAVRRFAPASLDDGRIHVVNADGRQFVRHCGSTFDAIIVDTPDPSTSQINRFYTAEFFRDAKARLCPGGVLSLPLGRYDDYVSPQLGRMLASAGRTLRGSFRNVLAIPAGRIVLLASDGELYADIAARIEQHGVATKLVNRHYLDAMLTPDRMADVSRAVSQAEKVNRDLSPILYYYHLQYWISQFPLGLGLLEAALAGMLVVYLVRLRAVPMAVFASGFAASALEVVLLLGFQVLCGSVYYQLGVIVTAFMAGLAAGALAANRLKSGNPRRELGKLALAVAGLAGLLPLALAYSGAESWAAGWVELAVGLLAFVLAALVGMQFPLACRAAFVGGAITASRLYVADFVGACLGALLASALLIPLSGVTATCLLAAGLNLVAAAVLRTRQIS